MEAITSKPKHKSEKVSNIQTNVLLGLATFQYLTFSQILLLNVGAKYYQYLHKQVMGLRERKRPLVACHNYSTPQPKRGRVESLYYLTIHGKKFLQQELNLHESEIKKPTSKSVPYKDYHHRKETITFFIHATKWAKEHHCEISFFDTYFEKSKQGSVFYAKTRIDIKAEYIIPDGAFKVTSLEKEHFFLFELHRGDETGRLIRQIHHHAQAMTYRATHAKYSLPISKGYSIVLLFELESTKNAFLKRIQKEGEVFKNIQQYFLIKNLGELEHFGEGWRSLFGEEKRFWI